MDDWRDVIDPATTVEHQGQQIPLRDHSFIRDAKDLPSFVKTAFDAHREVGARIPVKTDGKPESIQAWRKEHLPKLYQSGILEAPPATPEEYEINKPPDLPDEMWSKENAAEFQRVLHKHHIPKSAMADLVALHAKTVTGANDILKTSMDEGLKALKSEFGDKYDERAEMANRLAKTIFKTPEELDFYERVGLGNHPGFLGVLMRLAPLAMSDSSFVKDARIGGASGEDVRDEVSRIMSDPKHEMYEGYRRNDRKVMRYIDDLYKKAYGTGTQDISGGILVGPKPEP